MKEKGSFIWIPGYDDVAPHAGLLMDVKNEETAADFLDNVSSLIAILQDMADGGFLIDGDGGMPVHLECAVALAEDKDDAFGRAARVVPAEAVREKIADGTLSAPKWETWDKASFPSQHFSVDADSAKFGVADEKNVAESSDGRLYFTLDALDIENVLDGLDQEPASAPTDAPINL